MVKLPKLSFSNIFTFFLLAFALLMLFKPEAKSWLIQKLMVVGLFQPNIEELHSAEKLNSAEIIFSDASGKQTTLADLKGKVVFINFWATWCPPCIAEMPSINSLYNKFKSSDRIVFLITDADGDFNKSAEFMQNHHFNLPVYILVSTMPEALSSGSLPTTVILDKSGRIVFKEKGAANYFSTEMIKFITDLTDKP